MAGNRTITYVPAANGLALHEPGEAQIGYDGLTWLDERAGSITATGTAAEAKQYDDAVAGTITATGSSADGKVLADTVAGSITATGTASEAKLYTDAPAGSITASGTATDARVGAETSAGSITATGALAAESYGHFYTDTVAGTITILVGAKLWEWDATAATVAGDSASRWADWLANAETSADNLTASGGSASASYGVAVVYSGPDDPEVTVHGSSTYATYTSAPSRVTYLDNPVRIPDGAAPSTGSDRHLTIVDTTQAPWRIHDLWEARYDAGADRWQASGGVSYSLNPDGSHPANTHEGQAWTGNAANVPNLAGAITPEEIASGEITHALHFGYPNVATGDAVYPAGKNTPTGDNSSSVRQAEWIRLRPDYDVDARTDLPAWQLIVLKGLQAKGAFARDNSTQTAIYTIDPRNRGLTALNGGDPDDFVTAINGKGGSINSATNSARLGTFAGGWTDFPWEEMQLLEPPPVLEALVEGRSYDDAVAGSLSLTGVRTESRTGTRSVAGTVTATGSRAEASIGAVTPAGTLTLGGTASDEYLRPFEDTVAGTITLTGSVSESGAGESNDAPSGSITATGSTSEARIAAETVAGVLALAGASGDHLTFVETATGLTLVAGALEDESYDAPGETVAGTIRLGGAVLEERILQRPFFVGPLGFEAASMQTRDVESDLSFATPIEGD